MRPGLKTRGGVISSRHTSAFEGMDVSKPLKAVILEDRWQDAALMVRALEHSGYAVEWKPASSARDFEAALAERPDVVLADFHLPEYDAMTALAAVQRLQPDVPFIVVTGALGDEAAAGCIRAP
ncbi:MAG: response regulator, partial [Armatimonadetes bacterium]|nr:response regulator [Armatimonadota bacterium]